MASNETNESVDAVVEEDNSIKIKVESNEGTVFEMGLAAAKMSHLIKDMLETLTADGQKPDYSKPIPLKHDALTDNGLKKIIEWCEYHWDDPPLDPDFDDEKDRRNEELSYWDKKFIDVEDMALIYDIIIGANYLIIKGLVEVGGKHICSLIKGMTCQQVRDKLKIQNDFTPEEEEAIHKENEWIYAKDN